MFAGESVRSVIYPAASEAIMYGISKAHRNYRSMHEAVPEAYFVRQVYVNNYERNDDHAHTYLVEEQKLEAINEELHSFLDDLILDKPSSRDDHPISQSIFSEKCIIYPHLIEFRSTLTNETIRIALAGISEDNRFASLVVDYAASIILIKLGEGNYRQKG